MQLPSGRQTSQRIAGVRRQQPDTGGLCCCQDERKRGGLEGIKMPKLSLETGGRKDACLLRLN